jgi:FtsH-binding integral membrane protein
MSSLNSGFGGWNGFGQAPAGQAAGYGVSDSVLAAFFNAVFGWMAAGLSVTALVAWLAFKNMATVAPMLSGGGIIVLVVAELALVWVVSAAVRKISASVATVLFLIYAALNGVMLSGVFMVASPMNLAGAFLITAAMFGTMCVYGVVTKRNLASMRGLFMMALVGFCIATVVNVFVASSLLYWAITYGGVVLFCGLTAYDIQRLTSIAAMTAGDGELAARYSIVGALTLYLDFINLFLLILRILASNTRRR